MSIIKLLDEFTSEKLVTKSTSRREMFGTLGSFGKKAALAAIPFGMAAGSKANAAAMFQDNGGPISSLNLALTLEYLEAAFYRRALDSGVLEGGSREETVFMQLFKHEDQHVNFLVENLGDDAVESPEFDFTAGGAFDPFNENGIGQMDAMAQMLALAQAFEDTGVRAYKGQAANLMGTPFLEPALRIHSVEARHASEIRRIRGLKGWIVRDQRGEGMPEATQPVYNGEENVIQGGVDVSSISSGLVGNATDAATEAFDEILTGDEAVAIASLFIVSND
ncbi:ferritin-like domain-containing protein [Salegentibacter sp. JZCK2]|uniref:ferritin-like domain-containing protein n=1 Tax=Salegentibacter tibetensis TaxID=2873600 RepID=UPI001CD03E51|nr:ferritin-like domain-containing protein [Salegentibacter tibetensis]MBZ9730300.1 ferritin-like domain-containing protein [Salegentibacter tibetensis]